MSQTDSIRELSATEIDEVAGGVSVSVGGLGGIFKEVNTLVGDVGGLVTGLVGGVLGALGGLTGGLTGGL